MCYENVTQHNMYEYQANKCQYQDMEQDCCIVQLSELLLLFHANCSFDLLYSNSVRDRKGNSGRNRNQIAIIRPEPEPNRHPTKLQCYTPPFFFKTAAAWLKSSAAAYSA